MWAMEMHPNDRPTNVRVFQSALEGKTKRPEVTGADNLDLGINKVIRSNWLPITIVLSLLVVAVILTFLVS